MVGTWWIAAFCAVYIHHLVHQLEKSARAYKKEIINHWLYKAILEQTVHHLEQSLYEHGTISYCKPI